MSDLDLTDAIEAATKAVEAYQYIPDAGDGYPAIRMGTPESVARVAVEAAASFIEAAALRAAADLVDGPSLEGEFWAGWLRDSAVRIERAASSVSGAKAADHG